MTGAWTCTQPWRLSRDQQPQSHSHQTPHHYSKPAGSDGTGGDSRERTRGGDAVPSIAYELRNSSKSWRISALTGTAGKHVRTCAHLHMLKYRQHFEFFNVCRRLPTIATCINHGRIGPNEGHHGSPSLSSQAPPSSTASMGLTFRLSELLLNFHSDSTGCPGEPYVQNPHSAPRPVPWLLPQTGGVVSAGALRRCTGPTRHYLCGLPLSIISNSRSTARMINNLSDIQVPTVSESSHLSLYQTRTVHDSLIANKAHLDATGNAS